MRRISCLIAIAICVTGLAVTAKADPISTDVWYEFHFGGVGSPLEACGPCVPSSGTPITFAPNAPWTFLLATPGMLIVTDAFLAGDQFRFFDFGAQILDTNFVSASGHDCGNDPVPCLADPLMSHGFISLATGAHSLTGSTLASIAPGAAYFFVQSASIPEPGSMVLLGSGLAALIVARRRKRTGIV